MAIDYMLLIAIALIPLTIYSIKRKPKWLREMEEAMRWWNLLGQKLLEDEA